jgi:hypothetical protein
MRLFSLEEKLASILENKQKPTSDEEYLDLAWLCQQPYKKLFANSARMYEVAFANNPKLAEVIEKEVRYNAACAAALAGASQGEDKPKPDENERGKFRRQAHDWLRADLAAWSKLLDDKKPNIRQTIQQTLSHWKEDEDLAAIRDKGSLAKLPEAEQEAFRKLWAEVDQLLKRAKEGKK